MTGNFPYPSASCYFCSHVRMLLKILVASSLPILVSARCWHSKDVGCFEDDGSTRVLSDFIQLGEDKTQMDQVHIVVFRMIGHCQRLFSCYFKIVQDICAQICKNHGNYSFAGKHCYQIYPYIITCLMSVFTPAKKTGVEFSHQCFCGNHVNPKSKQTGAKCIRHPSVCAHKWIDGL